MCKIVGEFKIRGRVHSIQTHTLLVLVIPLETLFFGLSARPRNLCKWHHDSMNLGRGCHPHHITRDVVLFCCMGAVCVRSWRTEACQTKRGWRRWKTNSKRLGSWQRKLTENTTRYRTSFKRDSKKNNHTNTHKHGTV